MNDKIISTINKYSLISEGDTVLIGLSGGADSVFLTEFLLSVREKYNLTLKAAHIEHGIRGEESLADCDFVRKYCDENSIECFTLHIDAVNEAHKMRKSVEEYSRNRRYEFFNSIDCDKIATAHNLTDNIETVLMRLAKGTSLKGMCGIPVKRGKIIRPLIEISGYEIRNFLDCGNIPYCIDSTNRNNAYERNYVRNNILPLFEKLNPDFEASAARFIERAIEDNTFLDLCALEAFNSVFVNGTLDTKKLSCYSDSIIKRVLVKFFSLYNIKPSEFHICEVYRLVFASGRTQLTGGKFAVSSKNRLRITEQNAAMESDVRYEKAYFTAADFLNKCELYNKKFDFYCDCDKIVGNAVVRTRCEGDKISPRGRGCTKTLKKLFNELGIPVESRKKIPVVADDCGVIGVCGFCVDERVAVSNTTEKIFAVSVLTEENT